MSFLEQSHLSLSWVSSLNLNLRMLRFDYAYLFIHYSEQSTRIVLGVMLNAEVGMM